MVGRDDVLAVELDARQRLHGGAGGDDQVLGLDLLGADLDGAAVAHAAIPSDDLDLVLLHQVLHALEQLVHDGVAPGRDPGVVERDALRRDAELLAADRHAVVQLRRLQQRLGRDATDVEAGASELVRLDQGHLEAELGGPDRGGVPAHAPAEDRDVEVCSHS